MQSNCYRVLLVLVFIPPTFQQRLLHIMAPEKLRHIVYQTFPLPKVPNERIECYGTCDADTMNKERCDGQKVRLNCNREGHVKIHAAKLGRMKPAPNRPNICADKQALECVTDVTETIRRRCNDQKMCSFRVTNDPVRKTCGDVKYLAMDVEYTCHVKPTTSIPVTTTVTKTITKTTTTTTTTIKMPTSRRISTTNPTTKVDFSVTPMKKKTLSTGRETATTTTLPSIPTKSATATSTAVSRAEVTHDTDSFWIITAYATMYNSKFAEKHKGQIALVFLLSTFVGLVIFMCVYLDHCRRTKKKKNLLDKHCEEERPLKALFRKTNERLDVNVKPHDMVNGRGSLSNHNCVTCKHTGKCNNNHNDGVEEKGEEEEDAGVYVNSSVATPFLKRNLDHKIFIHSPSDSSQTIISPPLSTKTLNSTHHSPTEDILPPPLAFTGEESCVQCSTHTHSITSLASNSTLEKKRNHIHDKAGCLEVGCMESKLRERAYLEQDLRNKMEHLQREHGQLGGHISFEEYARTLPISGAMECRGTSSHCSSVTKHPANIDMTSHCSRFVMEPTRSCNCNSIERPRCNTAQSEGRRLSSNNKCVAKQHPTRGRMHKMQKCDGAKPQRSFNQKDIRSDNETSRRKRRCQAEYKRGCRCREQGTSLSDLDRGRKSDASSNFNCCSSLTSNGQSSSHEEFFEDNNDANAFRSVSSERFKNDEFRIEESGYHTHDTGTDSLCSSSFSTDQEDSRMFLPASLKHSTYACKSKHCHVRRGTGQRDQKLLTVRDVNKQKPPRRLRRDCYTDPDVHQHNCTDCTSVDVHSYDSSLDDASSKESEKKCQAMTVHKTVKHDCGLDGGKRCACMHVTIPPDAITTVDEINL